MTSAHGQRSSLTFSALPLVALGLPVVLPFSATVIIWAIRLPMRLGLAESLLATLGVLTAWLVLSSTIEVVLGGSDVSGTLTGKSISAGVTLCLLGGGYLLIVESVLASFIIAGTVAGLVFVLSVWADAKVGRNGQVRPVPGGQTTEIVRWNG